MDAGGAYGAGKAGTGFDPIVYIKKPQVILRIISWIFAVIVFGCIAAEGKQMGPNRKEYCVYNGDSAACGFGIAVGVFAFLACTLFLVIDAFFDNLSNVTHRKYAVIADLAFSAIWCFMWFVCFCYLTDAWRNTKEASIPAIARSQVKAAIAFSFFSVIPWAGLTVLAFMRYRQGAQSAFSPSYEPEPSSATNPYSSFPGDTGQPGDSYQQPPFAEKTDVPDSQYQAPSY